MSKITAFKYLIDFSCVLILRNSIDTLMRLAENLNIGKFYSAIDIDKALIIT